MTTIWKFALSPSELDSNGRMKVLMPARAQCLYAREQGEEICVWAIVNPRNALHSRSFEVFGTGHEVPELPKNESRNHLGSAHLQNGTLVFHVFEVIQ